MSICIIFGFILPKSEFNLKLHENSFMYDLQTAEVKPFFKMSSTAVTNSNPTLTSGTCKQSWSF